LMLTMRRNGRFQDCWKVLYFFSVVLRGNGKRGGWWKESGAPSFDLFDVQEILYSGYSDKEFNFA